MLCIPGNLPVPGGDTGCTFTHSPLLSVVGSVCPEYWRQWLPEKRLANVGCLSLTVLRLLLYKVISCRLEHRDYNCITSSAEGRTPPPLCLVCIQNVRAVIDLWSAHIFPPPSAHMLSTCQHNLHLDQSVALAWSMKYYFICN